MLREITHEIPNDFEAEQAILGSVLYDNSTLFDVKSIIEPSSFYTPAHQYIFRAFIELDDNKLAIDELLLGDQLKKLNQLEEIGGYSYLASLVDCVPSSGNVALYAGIINEKYRLRQLITTTTDIAKKSRDPEFMVDELIQEVLKTVESIGLKNSENNYLKIKDLIARRSIAYDGFITPGTENEWIKTGFHDFDKYINGLEKQKLYIIAARPAMGKTSLALNLVLKSKKYHTYKGAIVIMTYEMSGDEITDRLVTTLAKVNYNLFKRGKVNQQELDSIAGAMGEISELPIYVIDVTIPIEKLSIELKKIEKENGFIELLIVDYLQKAKVIDSRKPREQQISLISGLLKEYAKDFDCPVVALSQLNRDLEKRGDKKPMMADLRESGAIEQDADLIAFIYRDEVYNSQSEYKGTALILIEKQRSGPIGEFVLTFQDQYTLFENNQNDVYVPGNNR